MHSFFFTIDGFAYIQCDDAGIAVNLKMKDLFFVIFNKLGHGFFRPNSIDAVKASQLIFELAFC